MAASDSSCMDKRRHTHILCYAFNQDSSCFLCGTSRGFRVYICDPLQEFSMHEVTDEERGRTEYPHSSADFDHGIVHVAMLFRTKFFALVERRDPRKVRIWNDESRRYVGELRSRAEVKGVYLTRDIIGLVTEYAVYIYKCSPLEVIDHLHTGANPHGLCVVASENDAQTGAWRLACPAIAVGTVRVHTGPPASDDTNADSSRNMSHVFEAHNGPLAALAFNPDGSFIATASETGTVVRIFSSLNGQLVHELRRGAQTSLISCLCFRGDGSYLAVASSSPTVHVFKLVSPSSSFHHNPPPPSSSSTNSFFSNRREEESSMPPRSQLDFAAGGATSSWTGAGAGIVDGHFQFIPAVIRDGISSRVSDALKVVLPKPFNFVRGFAQFHIPNEDLLVDVRHPSANVIGPLCAFAGKNSNRLHVLHPNGVFYGCLFDESQGKECYKISKNTWFALRKDFKIQTSNSTETVRSNLEGGHEQDEWQVLG